MAEIKMINNKQDAVDAANRMLESIRKQNQEKKEEINNFISNLSNAPLEESMAEMQGMQEIAMMLSLTDEHFELLAPTFLSQLEQNYHNVNDQLAMVQTLNLAGLRAEDMKVQYFEICKEIDNAFGDTLSYSKRDFIKKILGLTYNAIAEAEGVAKKNILIPIELCNDNAKIPTYAHLTDSGMDVFALEDITIAPGETKLVPTGIKVAIPAGYELQVRPKSGRCLKTKLRVANTPGTIDAGYRDEIGVIIDNIEPFIKSADIDENGRLYNVEFGSSYTIGKGEKFAQLVLCEVPKAVFYEVENVGEVANDGRKGGFGSSGLK